MYGKAGKEACTPTRAFQHRKTMSASKTGSNRRLSMRTNGQPRYSTFNMTPLQPIRDVKKLMPGNVTKIHKFLVECSQADSSTVPPAEKDIRNPSRQFFLTMFEYIYQLIEVDYIYPQGARPEEEIMGIMKGLNCTVPLKINHFQPIGCPHGLPYLLDAIAWLVDFAEIQRQMESAPIHQAEVFDEHSTQQHNEITSEPWFKPLFSEFQTQNSLNLIASPTDPFWTDTKGKIRKYYEVNEETIKADSLKKEKLEQLRSECKEIEKEENDNQNLKEDILRFEDDIFKALEYSKYVECARETIESQLEETLGNLTLKREELAAWNTNINVQRQNIEEQLKEHGLTTSSAHQLMEENNQDKATVVEIQNELMAVSKTIWNLKDSQFEEIKQKIDSLLAQINKVLVEIDDSVDLKSLQSPKDEKSLQSNMERIMNVLSPEITRCLQQKKLHLTTEISQFPNRIAVERERLQMQNELLDEKEKAMRRQERLHSNQREEWKKERLEKEKMHDSLQNQMEVLRVTMNLDGNLDKEIEESKKRVERVEEEMTKKKEAVEMAIRKKLEEMLIETAKIESETMSFHMNCIELENLVKNSKSIV